VCVCVCICYTPVLYRNGLRVFSTYATLCFRELRLSPKIRTNPGPDLAGGRPGARVPCPPLNPALDKSIWNFVPNSVDVFLTAPDNNDRRFRCGQQSTIAGSRGGTRSGWECPRGLAGQRADTQEREKFICHLQQ